LDQYVLCDNSNPDMSLRMTSSRNHSFMAVAVTMLLLALHVPAALAEEDSPALSQAPITMSHVQSEDTEVGCWLKSIYTEAFRRLGYTMQYRQLPAARATYAAEHGVTDGELGRSQHYAPAHPALVRVEEPHLTEQFVAYMLIAPDTPLDWDTLIRSGLTIGYRNGMQFLKEKLAGVPLQRLSAVNSTEAGFRMLTKGRIDVFIETSKMYHQYVDEGPFCSIPIYPAGILDTHSAHAYLAAKHAQLAPRLAEVLRAMKREGLLARYAGQCNFDDTPPGPEQLRPK
jgi:hypothetical protein